MQFLSSPVYTNGLPSPVSHARFHVCSLMTELHASEMIMDSGSVDIGTEMWDFASAIGTGMINYACIYNNCPQLR